MGQASVMRPLSQELKTELNELAQLLPPDLSRSEIGGLIRIALNTPPAKELWNPDVGWPEELAGKYPGEEAVEYLSHLNQENPDPLKGEDYFRGQINRTRKLIFQEYLQDKFKIPHRNNR